MYVVSTTVYDMAKGSEYGPLVGVVCNIYSIM